MLDASDLRASEFWAAVLGGRVLPDETFHSVLDAAGEWRIGVQLAPDHVPPDWPSGAAQVHLDLHVSDAARAVEQVRGLGARLLRDGDLADEQDHRVHADPAGHSPR